MPERFLFYILYQAVVVHSIMQMNCIDISRKVKVEKLLGWNAANLIPIRTYPALKVIICGNIENLTYMASQNARYLN